MKRLTTIICLTLCLSLFLTGCRAAAATAEPVSDGGKISVVTSIFPPYDFVRAIGGDNVKLTMLLPPGAEAHSFEPTPRDIITIQNCDIFLYAGGGSDSWVERILESMDTDAMAVLPLVAMVDTVPEELVEGMEHNHGNEEEHEDHDHADHEEHDHDHDAPTDEHVWTSPANAKRIVEAISQSLQEADPDNAETYRQNTDAYLAELDKLDDAFREVAANSARDTLVFGDRFPFRYLADAYGLEYYAAFSGCSTDCEASAATVAFLIDKVKAEEIPAVFTIEFSAGKIADAICESTNAKKLLLHSCHNITKDEFESGVTYLELMEGNVRNLKEALS